MDTAFATEVGVRLGAKARLVGSELHAVVQHGDAFLSARAHDLPLGEVFVGTRRLDGFELAIRWSNRRGVAGGDDTFDRLFDFTTNDEALMNVWLDEVSRRALVASIYEFHSDQMPLIADHAAVLRRTWTYELRDDELIASKQAREREPQALARAVFTACALAARSQRWAADYAALARQLGGTAHGTLELGGPPIVTVIRDGVDVALRVLRYVPGAQPRLRTLVTAPRAGSGEGALGLVDSELPRPARIGVPAGKRRAFPLAGYELHATTDELAGKLAEPARKLVALARPAAVAIGADSVDVWLDGAPMVHARLDAAVTLASRLAVDAVAALGPYR